MSDNKFLFGKKNYILMISGLALIALGYLLMSGGSSATPDVFNEEMFSPLRIRIAPLIVVLGFIVEIWAILAKPKKD